MMLRMLRDRVLIQPIERQLSKLLIVKNSERYNIGTVVAIGPGKYAKGRVHPLDVKIGDTVRYGEFSFPEYRDGDIKYQIIQEADIAGIIEETA